MTLEEMKQQLMQYDEVTLLELLGLDSETLVELCEDQIIFNFDKLEEDLDDAQSSTTD